MTADHIVVFCTVPNAEDGAAMARQLVAEKLVACVNIVDQLRSIYVWQGEVCDDGEALMVMKTRHERFEALRERITALHSYDVPEVIALPIAAGHAPYLAWIDENVATD